MDTMMAGVEVSEETLDELCDIFKLFADKSRLKILLALTREGQMHVSALCELLDQSQPAVSHHLTLMRLSNLVGYRRRGKRNYYYVNSRLLSGLLEQFFTEAGNEDKQLRLDDFSLVYQKI